jgi:hypothetical protein
VFDDQPVSSSEPQCGQQAAFVLISLPQWGQIDELSFFDIFPEFASKYIFWNVDRQVKEI